MGRAGSHGGRYDYGQLVRALSGLLTGGGEGRRGRSEGGQLEGATKWGVEGRGSCVLCGVG